jgi:hypothetical protein
MLAAIVSKEDTQKPDALFTISGKKDWHEELRK